VVAAKDHTPSHVNWAGTLELVVSGWAVGYLTVQKTGAVKGQGTLSNLRLLSLFSKSCIDVPPLLVNTH
jgi:hypothetical protein